MTTRKLRRRPNDPINVNSSSSSSDKRRKLAPAQLAYLLDESEIIDDLRAITRGTGTAGKSSIHNLSSHYLMDLEVKKLDWDLIQFQSY